MRIAALLFMAIASLAMAGNSLAAGNRSKVHISTPGNTEQVKCTNDNRVTFNLKKNLVTLSGRCVLPKSKTRMVAQPVPSKLFYNYVAYDNAVPTNNACGSKPTAGNGETFKVVPQVSFKLIPPGAYKILLTVTLVPKGWAAKYRATTKPRTIILRGTAAICGRPASPSNPKGIPLPPPEVLCPGGDPKYGAFCGKPANPDGSPAPEACAWPGLPTITK